MHAHLMVITKNTECYRLKLFYANHPIIAVDWLQATMHRSGSGG